jgi:PAS domain S-box-containing protein
MTPNAAEPSRMAIPTPDAARPDENATHASRVDGTGNQAAIVYPIEQSFRQFAESLSDLVWSARPDGCTDYHNKRFLDYLGQGIGGKQGWTWAEILHPGDVEASRRAWEAAYTTGVEYDVEYRIRRHDGQYRWHRGHAAPMRDDSGRITRWFGTCSDIDDRKRAAEALRASEERFARFMQHLPGLAWIKDSQGRYIYANDDAERAFGTPRAALYGRTDEQVFPPETAAEFRGHDRRVLETGTGIRVIETLEHDDGTVHHSLVSKFPIPSPGDGEVLVGGMAIDITDRLEMEVALKEADRRKDEFLATLAHELRNPLAPIRNGLQIMRLAGADSPAVEETRTLMERQVRHMVRLIDDLLDVSRITRGKVELRKERVELANVVRNAVETSGPLIDASRHELAMTLPARPIYVDADVTRLSQVFSNLLNNAAKYTEPGGDIALVVERRGAEAMVAVRDNGVGIPPEMLPRVFDLFTQVDRSPERLQGGLGIGLTLVKRLVELHGGSIEARSGGRGLGSEFVVRLPMAADPPPEGTIAKGDVGLETPAPGRRILVVDDNHDLARTLARLLTLMGHDTRTAHDGSEAVAAAEEYRPEVILLDIGLPVMNGHEVARTIRKQPWGRDILIVALTGWGQEGDRRRSKEAGIDRHLVKPVEPQTLRELLSRMTVAPRLDGEDV